MIRSIHGHRHTRSDAHTHEPTHLYLQISQTLGLKYWSKFSMGKSLINFNLSFRISHFNLYVLHEKQLTITKRSRSDTRDQMQFYMNIFYLIYTHFATIFEQWKLVMEMMCLTVTISFQMSLKKCRSIDNIEWSIQIELNWSFN